MLFNTGEIDKLPPKIKKLILSDNFEDSDLGMELAKSFDVNIYAIERYLEMAGIGTWHDYIHLDDDDHPFWHGYLTDLELEDTKMDKKYVKANRKRRKANKKRKS